ncbi:MAG TPA: sigma 54-interacting transcriptional regulator [Polyangiaceae bacterium]|nr:sigma 54-interacting transcriptional regulator [Polyangiaceae bacterium]
MRVPKLVDVPALRALREAPSASVPEHLLALAEVGRELTVGGAVRAGIERAMQVLDRRLGAQRSVLYVADPERRALEIEATHGMGNEHLRPRFAGGVAGRVADSGRPIVVPIVRHEPMALSELADPVEWSEGTWSLVTVPVSMAGRRSGALAAYFRQAEEGEFAGRLSVLEVVASLLSQALRTADLERVAPGAPAPAELQGRQRSQATPFEYANMIGGSVAMRQVYEQIGQVAGTNATALIRGESGTGKELVAHAIHANSPRARHAFVKVNCAALPETLFESELFGHERGAFTGAHARKKGRFELAEGGTLFLDEIGELSPATQAKLLRVLQFREFERLGGTETLRTNVRIVVATNKDMERAVASGAFREDLYYRLNVFTITLPAVRERRADIAALAEYFLSKYADEHRRKIARISSGVLDVFSQYAWPGNVRELENVIERAVVVCDGFVIQEHHLPEAIRLSVRDKPAEKLNLADAVARLERQMIEEALQRTRGNAARAARALGTTERIVRYKAGKYGIDCSRLRG